MMVRDAILETKGRVVCVINYLPLRRVRLKGLSMHASPLEVKPTCNL